MISTLTLVTPPAVEPVSAELARAHARVDSDDSGLLAFYLAAARAQAENFLGRVLITQTLRWSIGPGAATQGPGMGLVPLTAPATLLAPGSLIVPPLGFAWPGRGTLELPRAPVQGVTSVTLGGLGETETTLTTDDYDLDLATDPARLRLVAAGVPRPLERLVVQFTAGYGDSGDAVPMPIRQAVLLLMAHLWENRGDSPAELPAAAQALLWPYRLSGF